MGQVITNVLYCQKTDILDSEMPAFTKAVKEKFGDDTEIEIDNYEEVEGKLITITRSSNPFVENDAIKNFNYTAEDLCFTALEANSTIAQSLGKDGCSYQTSTDGVNWTDYTLKTEIILANVGDKVYWRGTGSYNTTTGPIFVMTGKIAASGSVMSLLGDKYSTVIETENKAFYNLFKNCTALVTPPDLPATKLEKNCYGGMFYGCTGLTQAPILPATELANRCYYDMFYGCSSLTTAPELPATTLADFCYYNMFQECTSLTTAPELPITTLKSNCYRNMFNGCTALTTAPELPATTLAQSCYIGMFNGCSNLNYIKVGATSWDTSNAQGWVSSVSSTGTFVKPTGTEIPTETNGIPTGWTVQNI